MDYRCRLGSLSNSSTTSGSYSDLGEMVGLRVKVPTSSVSLSYFIIAVPLRRYLGQHP